MYDFDAEYKKIFETPVEDIREDIFFRADNFSKEKWYGDLQLFLVLGVCSPCKEDAQNLQRALKVLGYNTKSVNRPDGTYLVPEKSPLQRVSSKPHKSKDMER